MGEETGIDSVVVDWPDGDIETFNIPEINQHYLLIKGTGNAFPLDVKKEIIPNEFGLLNIYPNPFNLSTKVVFEIPQEGYVTIEIANLLGQVVWADKQYKKIPGKHSVKIGLNKSVSGVYFVILKFKNSMLSKKCLYLK